MGVFAFLSYSSPKPPGSQPTVDKNHEPEYVPSEVQTITSNDAPSHPVSIENASKTEVEPPSPKDVPLPASPASPSSQEINGRGDHGLDVKRKPEIRRFNFRSFSFVYGHEEHKPALSTGEDHEKKVRAAAAFSKRLATPLTMTSDKRAKESALIVRSLIIGPSSISPASPKSPTTMGIAKPQLSKIKSQLMQTKSANKLIAQLRSLPISEVLVGEKDENGQSVMARARGPIHAVCLEHPDAEEHELHFAKLEKEVDKTQLVMGSFDVPSVANASVETLTNMFKDMHIVSLISAPDLGFGQPGDGDGILAGAVPTAETVIKGVEQITPQLMALGFATGKLVYPSHQGELPYI